MKPCPACTRHVHVSESFCPFCATTLSCTGGAMVWVLALGAMGLSACGTDPAPAGDSTGSAESTMSSATSTMSASSTTSPGTSSSGTTSEGTTSIEPGDSSSTNDEGDLEGAFYGAPSDIGVDPACDLWAQDCPVGEKCTPWSPQRSWEGHCVPVDPAPAAAGEPCTIVGRPTDFLDDCEAGAWCYGVDFVASTGVCVALCTGGPANPLCNTGACTDHDDDGVVKLCLPSCDAAAPDCADDLTCTAGAALDGSDVCVAG